jgi:uncharacterized delta-60 repeat protein
MPGYTLNPNFNWGLGSGAASSLNVVGASFGAGGKKQTDWKTVIFSHYMNNYNGLAVNGIVRLDQGGNIDPTFNAGGSWFSLVGTPNIGYDYYVQPDNKILIVGNFTSYNGTPANQIIRLNANGSIDSSFVYGWWFNLYAQKIKPLPGGGYIIMGWFSAYNGVSVPQMVKVSSTGSIDNTFMGNLPNAGGVVYDVEVQSNGKVIIGGNAFLFRVHQDGTYDTSFNNGWSGFTWNASPSFTPSVWWPTNPTIYDMAVLPDDTIVAGWGFKAYNGVTANNLVKLNADGTLNTVFNNNLGLGMNWFVMGVTYDTYNDRLLVWGGFNAVNNQSGFSFVILNSNGTMYAGFPMTGFNDYAPSSTVISSDTFMVQGNFSSFQGQQTITGVAIFGPWCVPEVISTGSCIDNAFIHPDGMTFLQSYKDLINGVSVTQSNTPGFGTLNNVQGERDMAQWNLPTLASALIGTWIESFNSHYSETTGSYWASWSTQTKILRSIRGSVAWNYTFYWAAVPSPLQWPAYDPSGAYSNHVYAAILVPVSTYQGYAGAKTYNNLEPYGIDIRDVDSIIGYSLEWFTGYIASTEWANYNSIWSSKGIRVTLTHNGSATPEEFYILNNYDGTSNIRWKIFANGWFVAPYSCDINNVLLAGVCYTPPTIGWPGGVALIVTGGKVGINTATPQYALDVNGTIRAGAIFTLSDERLKSNIVKIDNALEKIRAVHGYEFTWKRDGKADMGVLAQEIEKTFTDVVRTDAHGEKTVQYTALLAPIIEAIHEMNTILDTDLASVKAQKKRIDALQK